MSTPREEDKNPKICKIIEALQKNQEILTDLSTTLKVQSNIVKEHTKIQQRFSLKQEEQSKLLEENNKKLERVLLVLENQQQNFPKVPFNNNLDPFTTIDEINREVESLEQPTNNHHIDNPTVNCFSCNVILYVIGSIILTLTAFIVLFQEEKLPVVVRVTPTESTCEMPFRVISSHSKLTLPQITNSLFELFPNVSFMEQQQQQQEMNSSIFLVFAHSSNHKPEHAFTWKDSDQLKQCNPNNTVLIATNLNELDRFTKDGLKTLKEIYPVKDILQLSWDSKGEHLSNKEPTQNSLARLEEIIKQACKEQEIQEIKEENLLLRITLLFFMKDFIFLKKLLKSYCISKNN
ncbi:hypothetical protein ABK040_006221 [Willaertia magna]